MYSNSVDSKAGGSAPTDPGLRSCVDGLQAVRTHFPDRLASLGEERGNSSPEVTHQVDIRFAPDDKSGYPDKKSGYPDRKSG